MTSQQIITWAIAVIACVCSVFAIRLSVRADRRALRAEKTSEASAERELWSRLIFAVQPAIGANVHHTDMHAMMVDIRTAMMELVDGLDHHEYSDLDRWMQAEHQLMAGLFEETSRGIAGRNPSVEEMVEAHARPAKWAAALISNLRYARTLGSSQDTDHKFTEVADQTEKTIKDLLPSTRIIKNPNAADGA